MLVQLLSVWPCARLSRNLETTAAAVVPCYFNLISFWSSVDIDLLWFKKNKLTASFSCSDQVEIGILFPFLVLLLWCVIIEQFSQSVSLAYLLSILSACWGKKKFITKGRSIVEARGDGSEGGACQNSIFLSCCLISLSLPCSSRISLFLFPMYIFLILSLFSLQLAVCTCFLQPQFFVMCSCMCWFHGVHAGVVHWGDCNCRPCEGNSSPKRDGEI